MIAFHNAQHALIKQVCYIPYE